jgi:AcrR family transcriptional regulator
MVETAAALLQTRGYAATSWRDLVDEAGTPWGSAHYHFPGGKEELAVAAVDLGARRVAEALDECLAASSSVPQGVRRWFEASAAATRSSQFTAGCPVATVALETSAELTGLSTACAEAFDAWRTLVMEALMGAGIGRVRARELATITIALLEGALLLARTSRSTTPVIQAAKHVESVLADELARLSADHRGS